MKATALLMVAFMASDQGFMRMPSGAEKRWTKADVPITVMVAPDADAMYWHDTQDAVRVINRVVGFVLLARPSRCTVDYVQRFHREARGLLGVILIQADLVDDKRAGTYHNVYPNGIIKSVYIVMPEVKPGYDPTLSVAHELLHALGLAHDSSPFSIMFHRRVPGQRLTRADYRRLVEAYKP